MSAARWTERVVVAYPAWWRRRYGPELAQLVDDLVASGRSPLAVGLSVLRGGLATRLSGVEMPPVPALWADRTKWLITSAVMPMVFGGWFLGVWLADGWQQTSAFVRGGLSGRIANDAWTVANVAELAALLAAVLAWSVVFDGLKWGRERRPRLLARLLFLPFIALVLAAASPSLRGLFGVRYRHIAHVARTAHGSGTWSTAVAVPVHPAISALITVVVTGIGVAALTLTPAAGLLAVSRAPANPYLIGRAIRVGWALVAALAVKLGASVVATIALARSAFGPFTPTIGPMSVRSGPPWWWPEALVALASLTVAGATALRAARRAWKVSGRLASPS